MSAFIEGKLWANSTDTYLNPPQRTNFGTQAISFLGSVFQATTGVYSGLIFSSRAVDGIYAVLKSVTHFSDAKAHKIAIACGGLGSFSVLHNFVLSHQDPSLAYFQSGILSGALICPMGLAALEGCYEDFNLNYAYAGTITGTSVSMFLMLTKQATPLPAMALGLLTSYKVSKFVSAYLHEAN